MGVTLDELDLIGVLPDVHEEVFAASHMGE